MGHGAQGRNLTVRISYHSHVYSKADTAGAVETRFRDEAGKFREFCTERYTLCLNLPELCNQMIVGNFPSWPSKDKNNINNMAICEAQPTTGDKYLILYDLNPSAADGIDTELVVKSAYNKFVDMRYTGKREKIRALIKRSHFQNIRIP